MDRFKIKEEAKKLISNNLWNIWKPYLVIMLINLAISLVLSRTFHFDPQSIQTSVSDGLISFVMLPLSIGYLTYILNFVRGKKYELKDIFSKMNNLLSIWIINLIISICVSIGTVLLIVPGIIIGLMFTMTSYILAEGETNIGDTLRKSADLIKGYKWDYFVFCLSFLGWILLSVLTIGIALIWVMPYMNVSMALYYEELKKLKK